MNWLFGKTKTPDGTTVIRHSKIETRVGTAPETRGFIEAREAAYERLYEQPVSVSHEVFPLVPHIDVYQFRPKMKDRSICRLVTGGMSDLPMTMPQEQLTPHAAWNCFSTATNRATSISPHCGG